MSITIFSGTFNPIHIGHLIIAEIVSEEISVDKIQFIPAYCPPHRNISLADPNHRFNMVKLAIADNPHFEINDIEFRLKDKSFTYLTVIRLLEEYAGITQKINLIIGADAFNLIDSWYEIDKLSKLVRFIIVGRPDSDIEKILNEVKLKNFNFELVRAPLLEISSSYIRQRIREKKSVKYLVPESVEDYIFENGLFL